MRGHRRVTGYYVACVQGHISELLLYIKGLAPFSGIVKFSFFSLDFLGQIYFITLNIR
jgi:hypothetical protein